MLKAIDFCKTTFNESIKISAQAYLEKFYTDLGFNVVSEPYLEDDIPHIAMVLK
jgi:ElaA protein